MSVMHNPPLSENVWCIFIYDNKMKESIIMFETDISNEFRKDIWMDKMTNAYTNQMRNDPTDKSLFIQTQLWKDIVSTVKQIAGKYNLMTNIAVASLAETCDGGCLEAAISISYATMGTLSNQPSPIVTINLVSEY